MLNYDWDEAKNRSNRQKQGIALDEIDRFDWDYASGPQLEFVDREQREKWVGPIGQRLYVVILIMRGDTMRIISLRLAIRSEAREWRREFQNE